MQTKDSCHCEVILENPKGLGPAGANKTQRSNVGHAWWETMTGYTPKSQREISRENIRNKQGNPEIFRTETLVD